MRFKQLLFLILTIFFTQGVFSHEAKVKETSSQTIPSVEIIFETSMGFFTLELDQKKAPKTVENFLGYVDEDFYSNTLFHRVIPRFMVQSGGFEKGMKQKMTHLPVKNESNNGLKNIRGTISMARTSSPDSATSQFFINVKQNASLDQKGNKLGYTVFGKVTAGMDVIDKITGVPTKTSGSYKNVPKKDIYILTAKRKGAVAAKQEKFIAGQHYIVLDKPVPTRDRSKVEVIEMFSFACPHCYEFEPFIKKWEKKQTSGVDFWFFPAVWNEPMKLYAKAFYTAQMLNIEEIIHLPLLTALVIEQRQIRSKNDLVDFFVGYGVDKGAFAKAYGSTEVEKQVDQAEARVRSYKPAGVPEIVVNGKYRVDRARAGGQEEMLAVVDFLIKKERAKLIK